MISSDYRIKARKMLEGKWGKAVGITFVYMLIFFVINLIQQRIPQNSQSLFSLFTSIIEVPLSFGLIFSFFNLFIAEKVNVFSFLSLGFRNFGKSWGIAFRIFLKLLFPILLILIAYMLIAVDLISRSMFAFIDVSKNYSLINPYIVTNLSVPSIIGFILLIVGFCWSILVSYYYKLAYLIAAENPEISSKEAVNKSKELMQNRRWKLFCLHFSFIGWLILSILTFGIGFLWFVPYIQFASIAFYKDTLETTENSVQEEVIETKK